MEIKLEQLSEKFRSRYSTTPRFFQAPGRVNLIGEHTDYNDGFVMPFAIDRRAVAAGAIRDDSRLHAYALDLNETAEIDLNALPVTRRGNWVDYVEGTVRCVAERFGIAPRGADLMISSTVPIGAGLSSSAALEISIGLAYLALTETAIDRKELAFAGQQAEHKFAGTRSGIMDQFAAAFGKSGDAMLLDCRSLDIDYIPIAHEAATIVVIDTKVKHNLASSEYNVRRSECEEAVEILQKVMPEITSLRDMTIGTLETHARLLSDVVLRRCRHVVTENDRTQSAALAFRQGDFETAGRLMYESHRSLRDDYEVSCLELDTLVEIASSVDGVFGARMTGGGFGGCTVNLVETKMVETLREKVLNDYAARFGEDPGFYIFQPADGASEITASGTARSPIEASGSSM